MSRDASGPAFPTPHTTGDRGEYTTDYTDGMTLRDYFAAKALAGMPVKWDGGYSDADHKFGTAKFEATWYAKAAYRIADAMLAERVK